MTTSNPSQKLIVFLCHAQEDKPKVVELYDRLRSVSWIDPWLSDAKLLPGQEWKTEINDALNTAHVIIICLSNNAIAKAGYVQKEIKLALDIADEKPEGSIFIIPWLFDECVVPTSLKKYHWVSPFLSNSYSMLLLSLEENARKLHIEINGEPAANTYYDNEDLALYKFEKVSAEDVPLPYTFYIGKYPVTNAQFKRFLTAKDCGLKFHWIGIPQFNEDCIQIGKWGFDGWNWLQKKTKMAGIHPMPGSWEDKDFGITNPNNPVVSITWYEANAYCKWLLHHWQNLEESRANPDLLPKSIRLPLEFEWTAAAGGEEPQDRYPWDKVGQATKDDKEIARRANVNENIGHTTAVNAYLRGASHPYKIMDMGGNVWEWQANFYDRSHKGLALRGGAWDYYQYGARVSRRYTFLPDEPDLKNVGFRVVCLA